MQKVIALFALLLSFSTVDAQTEAQAQAITYYNQAVAATNANDLPASIELLTKALMKDANFDKAYYQRGLNKMQMLKFGAAAADLKKYVELRPESPEGHYYKGYCEMQSDNPNAAIGSFTKTLKLDDTQDKAYFYRAYLMLLDEKYEDALAGFDEVLALGGKFETLWSYKAVCHYRLEEYGAAAQAYARHLDDNPNDTKAMLSRAQALNVIEDYEGYLDQMQTYLRMEKGSKDNYMSIGYANLKLEKFQEARTYFDKVLSIEPSNQTALKNNLYMSGKLNDTALLEKDYTAMIAAEGTTSEYYYLRALLYVNNKNQPAAEQDLNAFIAAHPDHAEAHYNRASVYANAEDYSAACDDFRKAAELGMEEAYQYVSSYCKAAGK